MAKLIKDLELTDEVKPELPYTAAGLFKDKDGMYKMVSIKYNADMQLAVEEVKDLNLDKEIAKNMWRVFVVKKGII